VPGKNQHRFWWDDWLALVAAILTIAFIGIAFSLVHYGFGRHIWMIPPENLPKIFKLLYSVYFVYDISLSVSKASALFFLTRLFPRHANSRWWNYTLWTTHAMNIAWAVGKILGVVFMCSPVQKGWDPMRPGHCAPTGRLWSGGTIPSVVIDLLILALPVPKIWSLRISRSRKVGVMFVFILGYCAVIVSLGRMITIMKNPDAMNKDITYNAMPAVYWISAEAPITIASICMPPMLNIARRFYITCITPISSKISSLMSTRTGGDSRYDSQLDTLEGGLKRSDNNSQVHLHGVADGSDPYSVDLQPSVYSTESRSELVPNTTKPQPAVHTKGSELGDTSQYQHQFVASIEGGGRESFGNYNLPPTQHIRVDRHFGVNHQDGPA
jgi:hypothetical protein